MGIFTSRKGTYITPDWDKWRDNIENKVPFNPVCQGNAYKQIVELSQKFSRVKTIEARSDGATRATSNETSPSHKLHRRIQNPEETNQTEETGVQEQVPNTVGQQGAMGSSANC